MIKRSEATKVAEATEVLLSLGNVEYINVEKLDIEKAIFLKTMTYIKYLVN